MIDCNLKTALYCGCRCSDECYNWGVSVGCNAIVGVMGYGGWGLLG